MSKFTCEIVKDFDGTYYANMYINGEYVRGLSAVYFYYLSWSCV